MLRIKSNNDATLSILSIDGQFECFGLEDEHREEKVVHETRIPAGTYEIKLKKHGGFHQRYSQRFSQFHMGMLHLQDVPGFNDILIHVGNTDDDTSGCILVGNNGNTAGNYLTVTSSTVAYAQVYEKVWRQAHKYNLKIQIIDLDR